MIKSLKSINKKLALTLFYYVSREYGWVIQESLLG